MMSPSEPATPAPSLGGEVTLITHDSFAASDSVIADFESQSGVKLNVLKGGDAGAMVNQAILTKDNPLGDALYGVDNTFLSRALDAGIFVPYLSPAASELGADFKLDPQNRVTPIDYGDVCVVYDIKTSASLPATINDLTLPAYKGKLVVENPATSSPGLAFMLATIVRFGETGSYTWLDYWRDLRANNVFVANDWNDAYYNEFSAGGGGGKYPFVVSYATDPAADVVFSGDESATPNVQKLDDGCFRQIEFVGVLAGAKNPAGAEAWIDFMASPEFQSDIPLNMFVFPADLNAPVPDVFAQYAAQATDPLTMDPADIAANRDRWIQEWTDTVLH
jgi:thiamine transport system substrate-binding protein